MFRFSLDIRFGRDNGDEPTPGESGDGTAQVELADETPGLRVGFTRPEGDTW